VNGNGRQDWSKVTLTPFAHRIARMNIKDISRNFWLIRKSVLKILSILIIIYTSTVLYRLNQLGNQWPLKEMPVVAAVQMLALERGWALDKNIDDGGRPLCRSGDFSTGQHKCSLVVPDMSYFVCYYWIYNPFYKDGCRSIRVDESIIKSEDFKKVIFDAVHNLCSILRRNDASGTLLSYGHCYPDRNDYYSEINVVVVEIYGPRGFVGRMNINKNEEGVK